VLNTNILSVVKSEVERRHAPAVVAVKKYREKQASENYRQSYSIREKLAAYKNTYNGLCQVMRVKSKNLNLPGRGNKYDEVLRELLKAGIEIDEIAYQNYTEKNKLLDHINAIFITFTTFLKLRKIYKSEYSLRYLDVIVRYVALTDYLSKKSKVSWIIIGDLSTSLIALSGAIKESGHRLIYWQYSFLDFKHLPSSADIAVLLNHTGLELARLKKKDYGLNTYWRDIGDVTTLNLEDIKKDPVGVLLNVHAQENVLDLVTVLQQELGLKVEIRLHPNSNLKWNNLPPDIILADPEESLDDFAKRISLGVCGNTQAQAKLLMYGTPVIQLAGLDMLPFDFHDYVKKDIVYGIRTIEEFSFEKVSSFYKSKKYNFGLHSLIGPIGIQRNPMLSRELLKFKKNLKIE
jgi:hypothetical protein